MVEVLGDTGGGVHGGVEGGSSGGFIPWVSVRKMCLSSLVHGTTGKQWG